MKLAEKLKESGSSFGHFAKDSYNSDFVKGWNSIIEECNIKMVTELLFSCCNLFSKMMGFFFAILSYTYNSRKMLI